eukprot:8584409-Pyramimonas_sp.AAC.1
MLLLYCSTSVTLLQPVLEYDCYHYYYYGYYATPPTTTTTTTTTLLEYYSSHYYSPSTYYNFLLQPALKFRCYYNTRVLPPHRITAVLPLQC